MVFGLWKVVFTVFTKKHTFLWYY